MKRISYFIAITALVFAQTLIGQDELKTRVYDFGGENPFSFWKADDLEPEPFADPVVEGKKPAKRQVTAESVLTTAGLNFGIGSSAGFDPATMQLTITTSAAELTLAEAFFDEFWKGQSQKSLNCIFEMIEVDHDEFSDWLFENRLIGDDTPLRNEIQKWVKEKRATIIETAQIRARSGQRAKIEGVEEFIYPTEMDPPEIPNQVTLSGGAISPITAGTATAFETRNMGMTLEVDPVLGADNVTVDLNLSPELVKLKEYSEWGPDVQEKFFVTKLPTFYTIRTTSQIAVRDGRNTLLSTARPMEPNDPKRTNPLILSFVRVDVVSAQNWTRVDEVAK